MRATRAHQDQGPERRGTGRVSAPAYFFRRQNSGTFDSGAGRDRHSTRSGWTAIDRCSGWNWNRIGHQGTGNIVLPSAVNPSNPPVLSLTGFNLVIACVRVPVSPPRMR